MSQPIIQTQQLTKTYREIVAVDHLDLTVNEGEVFGFLGPNGAGKTTTILLLTGLTTPTHGTATVGGYDVVKDSKRIREIVGQLPEFAGYYEDLTARQNLDYIGRLNDLPRAEREKRIDGSGGFLSARISVARISPSLRPEKEKRGCFFLLPGGAPWIRE